MCVCAPAVFLSCAHVLSPSRALSSPSLPPSYPPTLPPFFPRPFPPSLFLSLARSLSLSRWRARLSPSSSLPRSRSLPLDAVLSNGCLCLCVSVCMCACLYAADETAALAGFVQLITMCMQRTQRRPVRGMRARKLQTTERVVGVCRLSTPDEFAVGQLARDSLSMQRRLHRRRRCRVSGMRGRQIQDQHRQRRLHLVPAASIFKEWQLFVLQLHVQRGVNAVKLSFFKRISYSKLISSMNVYQ